jgi:hypothetical protein
MLRRSASLAFVVTFLVSRAQADPPAVRVTNIRRAFHNGEHNAFTDLVRFKDRLYLTFRSCPDGHMVFPSSSIIVLASDDGYGWKQVHRFSVPKRDTRDPHFVVFRDRLFLYTGTWYCGDGPPEHRDLNEHLGYSAWTDNGADWHSPVMLEGTYGHYVWRAAVNRDRVYLCGRRKHEFVKIDTPEDDPAVESAMLESDDGLVFRFRGLFQEQYGDETAFLFEDDGSLLAIARSGSGRDAQLVRSTPPYEAFQRVDLGRYIGGPLLTKWNGRYLVGGRRTIGDPRTVLYWLEGEQLTEFAELPSAGDNSYPGFVQLDETRALLSWYSSHERDDAGKVITAIYLADLKTE